MTRYIASIVLGSVFAFGGCEKKEADKPSVPTAPKTGAGSTGGASGMLDAGKAALGDAKEKAVAAANSTMDTLTKQFEALKAKAPAVPADAKTAFDGAMKDLDTQFASAKTQFESLKSSAADAWQKSSTDLQTTLTKLTDSLKVTADKFGK